VSCNGPETLFPEGGVWPSGKMKIRRIYNRSKISAGSSQANADSFRISQTQPFAAFCR
jgi:hypothetical protein